MAPEKWLVDEPTTIELEGIRRLRVGLVGGHVDVLAHDEPTVRIEVHSVSGKDIRITADGDRVEIDHAQLSWETWLDVVRNLRPGASRADVSILVPRESSLKLGVVSASALVSGLRGDADLSTVGGEIVADGLDGALKLNAVNAELTVRGHTGTIEAHTVSGDITASGAVTRFTADGVSGNVYLDLRGIPDLVRVNTVSGDVTTRLDEGVAASYAISTVSGKLQLGDSSIRGVRGRFTGKHGKLEGRWLDFRANTVSGDVSVLHAASRSETAAAS